MSIIHLISAQIRLYRASSARIFEPNAIGGIYGLYSVGFGRWLLGWEVTVATVRGSSVRMCILEAEVSPLSKIGSKTQKHKVMTSAEHGGPICQDDNSATTRPQKPIRHAIESSEPPLSRLCVEIAVNNANRGRI